MKRQPYFARFGFITMLFLVFTQLMGATVFAVQETAQDPATRIDTFLDRLVEDELFSGAVLVARDGEILLSEGYGMANYDWNVPNTAETKFRIGSLTKQFTAMSILLLQEQGKLRIQDPLCTYLEECPDIWAAMTIEQLMNHTSGMTGFWDWREGDLRDLMPISINQMIEQFKTERLEFEPGEGWYYTNMGYDVLGYLIQAVSGQSYTRFLQGHIFDPLGMSNTGYDDNSRVISNRAIGYLDARRVAPYLDTSIPYAAGGLYSTTSDLYIWITALMDGKVVPQEALNTMWDAAVPVPASNPLGDVFDRYGYGIAIYRNVNRTVVGHGGTTNGFVSRLIYLPDENVTIIVLSNFRDAAVGLITESSMRVLLGEE